MSISDDDNAYSMIFASLKHPIRRKILRILSSSSESFSDLQKQFKIESSHLTYHLEGLGNLLYKTEDGKYTLSSFGEAAVSMMKHVEEPPRASLHLPYVTMHRARILKSSSLILVCGLITSLIFNCVFLFRNAALDTTGNALDEAYNELNKTYRELDRAYDDLNRVYYSYMPRALGFQTITYANAPDQSSQACYIVENQSSWVEIWNKIEPYAVYVENGSRVIWIPPDVNFSESIVIAAFMGTIASGGHRIEVKEILDVGQYVTVKIEKTHPGENCAVTLGSTAPCHVIKMATIDKPIVFVTTERTVDCPPY